MPGADPLTALSQQAGVFGPGQGDAVDVFYRTYGYAILRGMVGDATVGGAGDRVRRGPEEAGGRGSRPAFRHHAADRAGPAKRPPASPTTSPTSPNCRRPPAASCTSPAWSASSAGGWGTPCGATKATTSDSSTRTPGPPRRAATPGSAGTATGRPTRTSTCARPRPSLFTSMPPARPTASCGWYPAANAGRRPRPTTTSTRRRARRGGSLRRLRRRAPAVAHAPGLRQGGGRGRGVRREGRHSFSTTATCGIPRPGPPTMRPAGATSGVAGSPASRRRRSAPPTSARTPPAEGFRLGSRDLTGQIGWRAALGRRRHYRPGWRAAHRRSPG